MPQWEYRKINLNDTPRRGDDIDLLNEAGDTGWELVGITSNSFAYLKRRIEEVAPAPEPAPAPARATRRKAATSAT